MTGRPTPSLLHVDLDAFYASVEQLDDPTLRGRPVVVGGLGPRGVVAAASYEARRFGIRSALPMASARRLAPLDAVFLAPRMERYRAESRVVMDILRAVTPLVEPIASDEAFLDVAGAARTHGEPAEIIAALRAHISDRTGLAASVGAATTKFLAKLASDLAKPDGVLVVEPGSELEVLRPLEVRRLWGVGPATHAKLERLGIRSIGDLATMDVATLTTALGRRRAEHLLALAQGRDDRQVEPERRAKSVSHEETFAEDVTDRRRLEHELVGLVDRVGTRLRRDHLAGRTIQLKIRYGDFTTITRSHTRSDATDLSAEIALDARALLDAVDVRDGVRLLGIGVGQLEAPATQPELPFGSPAGRPPSRRRELERTVDAVRARFGVDALRPGTS